MRCVLGSELNLWISLQGFIQIQDIIWGEELQTLWERPWTPISGGCYTSRLTKQLIMISCINCFAQLYFLIMFLTTASCERNARNGGNLELLGNKYKDENLKNIFLIQVYICHSYFLAFTFEVKIQR